MTIVSVNGKDFLRIDTGKLQLAAASPDEPYLLTSYAQPSRKQDTNSTYRHVLEQHKNVIVGGVTQKDDDILRIQLSVTTRHRSFTETDVSNALYDLTWLFTNATSGPSNVGLWLRGVRDFS